MFIGGKSMGGRIASHLAAAGDATAAAISGLVLFGYPLHPPGKPEQLRIAHLPNIRVPVLVVQGNAIRSDRRTNCARIWRRSLPVVINVIEGGDHSLAPPKRGGRSADQVHSEIQDAVAAGIADR